MSQDSRLYVHKQAIANLAKGQTIAWQVKGLVIDLVIAQEWIHNILLWLTPIACRG